MNWFKKIVEKNKEFEAQQKEKEYQDTLKRFREININFIVSCEVKLEDKIEILEANYHYYKVYLRELKKSQEEHNELISKHL